MKNLNQDNRSTGQRLETETLDIRNRSVIRPRRSVGKLSACILFTYVAYSLFNNAFTEFVLDRSRVKISVRRLPVLTDVFRDFPQSLQTNSG
jgi:hypothetical protein